jgi:hypothetical protein
MVVPQTSSWSCEFLPWSSELQLRLHANDCWSAGFGLGLRCQTVYRTRDEGAEVSQSLSAKKLRFFPNSADIQHPKSLKHAFDSSRFVN